MTIYDYLVYMYIETQHNRIERLEEIRAPKIILELEHEELARLVSYDLGKVNGQSELLEEEYIKHEKRKGSGGKNYIVFNDNILYYPNAKYGQFVKRAE